MNQNKQLQRTWKKRINDYRVSGLSMKKWCETHDLKLHQLQYWNKKFKKEDLAPKPLSQWIPVQLEKPNDNQNSEDSIQLKVGPGIIDVKPGFDPMSLKNLVKVLMDLC